MWAGLKRGDVYVLAYLEEDFQGKEYKIPVPVEIPSSANLMRILNMPTDRIASLKVPEGVLITLYDHSAYGGVNDNFTGEVPKLGMMKSRASALKTEFLEDLTKNETPGKVYVTIYLKKGLQGRPYRLEVPTEVVDDVALLQLGIPSDSIASLDIPEGVKVTLFDHAKFGGRHESFTGKVADLGLMTSVTSSLKAELVKKP